MIKFRLFMEQIANYDNHQPDDSVVARGNRYIEVDSKAASGNVTRITQSRTKIAVLSSVAVDVYDNDGTLLQTFAGSPVDCAFSDDGSQLVITGVDTRVYDTSTWEYTSFPEVGQWCRYHDKEVVLATRTGTTLYVMFYAPSGRLTKQRVITVSESGTVSFDATNFYIAVGDSTLGNVRIYIGVYLIDTWTQADFGHHVASAGASCFMTSSTSTGVYGLTFNGNTVVGNASTDMERDEVQFMGGSDGIVAVQTQNGYAKLVAEGSTNVWTVTGYIVGSHDVVSASTVVAVTAIGGTLRLYKPSPENLGVSENISTGMTLPSYTGMCVDINTDGDLNITLPLVSTPLAECVVHCKSTVIAGPTPDGGWTCTINDGLSYYSFRFAGSFLIRYKFIPSYNGWVLVCQWVG